VSGPWIAAVLALWAVVVLLAVLVLGLLRRIAPVLEQAERATRAGLAMDADLGAPDGTTVPSFAVVDAAGRSVPFEDVGPADRVVLFVDADCPACGAVTAGLAADPATATLPLVVVTGRSTPPSRYDALAAIGVPVVGQPDGAATTAFAQRAFPLAFAVAGGTVVASAVPGSVADLERLAGLLSHRDASRSRP
jgi:hypothetical protein